MTAGCFAPLWSPGKSRSVSGSHYGVSDPAPIGNGDTLNVRANGDTIKLHPVPTNPFSTAPFGPFGDSSHRGVQTGASSCAGDNSPGFFLTQPLLGDLGSSGRNSLQLDGVNNFDLALMKDTKITEGKNLQCRWEVYNIFSPANFSGFTNTLISKNFGTYTSIATNMRQMQGSLKFTF
jgi:hypothetical protein